MALVRFDPDQGGLHALLDSPSGDIARDVERRCLKVERAAKRLAPVDTGRLRSSITHETTTDGQGVVGIVGTDVEYAPHQEFGTRYQSGTPFLLPALQEAGGV